MGDPKQLVPIIVGPTAVGKTGLACEIARHVRIAVISADSRQIYRKLDIGTAKPTPVELRAVPHYGLDVVDPGENYSAGRFAADAARWISEIPEERQAVVVGGTGFYVRALAEGLFREPEMDRERRARFRAWADRAGGLSKWAFRLDPEYAGGGKQRSARVVEVALLTGQPLSWWQRQATNESPIVPWYVRLTAPRSVLHNRIENRVREMLESGLVQEVEALLANGILPEAHGLDAVGYRETTAFLRGEIGADELTQRIATSTRRYAKRQETWFRHQLRGADVHVMDVTEGLEALAVRFVGLWKKVKD